MSPFIRTRLGGLLAALVLAACSPHRVDETPSPPLTVPETFGSETREGALPERWWESFGDPGLAALISRALEGSPRMHIAWARLKQAEASGQLARAARWPTADLQASAAYRENFFPPFGTIDQKTYSLSMPVAYEVDVWNRYGSAAEAGTYNVMATRNDVEATAMSVAAEVAEAWFDVVNARAARALLESQLEVNTTLESLVRLRFERGISSALDVYQQQQQVLATQTQLATVDGQERLARARLAILEGVPAQKLALPDNASLPELAGLPGLGVPADLLERRPDLRAVRDRIVAQDYQLAAAIAARLPSFVLNGSLSFSATTPADLLDTLLKSLSLSLNAPLFDGGRRAAEAKRQRALLEEIVANYAQVLLQAMLEVDNALVREDQQTKSLDLLEAQRETAEATLREARARYEQGLSDYLPVLTSLNGLQGLERSLLDGKRQRLSARIQLCRALGGTWTVALSRKNPAKDPS
jgi:NodT family efflux transporter outer membrane factor (OMF) lipoprotein